MNNELQEALTAFLTKSLDVVEKGVNMAGEQIPLVLQEIIQWEIWSSTIGFVIALIISVCLAIAGWFCSKRMRMIRDDFPFDLGAIVSFGGALLAFAISMGNLYHMIKALTAPRLVIIEFLKGML